MTQTHPITPPPELVQQWIMEATEPSYVPTQAAQWGADQELEATLGLMETLNIRGVDYIRAVRRPKPPSLKEQALKAIGVPTKFGEARVIEHREHELVRRALEALDG